MFQSLLLAKEKYVSLWKVCRHTHLFFYLIKLFESYQLPVLEHLLYKDVFSLTMAFKNNKIIPFLPLTFL